MPAGADSRRRLGIEVGYDDSDVKAGVPRTQQAIRDLGSSSSFASQGVGLLKGALGALGGVLTVREVAQYVGEVSRMAEQSDRSRQAVIALSGSVSEANAIIGSIQEAGDGAISRLDATSFAARALALGLADTSEEAALFTRTVTVLGASVGKDATESFDQLQLAIANLSFERLDSLGISASRVRESFILLKASGVEATEAFRLAVLEEAAQRLEILDKAGFDASTGTSALAASWENLRLTLGERFSPAYQGASQALAGGLTYIEQNIDSILQLEQTARNLINPLTGVTQAALTQANASAEASKSLSIQTVEMEKQINSASRGEGASVIFGNALLFVANATDIAAGAVSRADGILGAFTGTMANAIGVADGLGSALYRLAAAQAAQSPQNGLDFARTQLGFAQNSFDSSSTFTGRINAFAGIVEAQNAVTGAEEQVRAENERTKDAYKANKLAEVRAAEAAGRSAISSANKAAKEQERIAKELAQAYEQEFSRIGGFVSSALSFQGGVQPFDDLLDRTGVGRDENTTNETIRRLEDVRDRALEGNRSQWIEKFLGVDDANLEVVAARAERRIRDLQAGLFTNTLDREGIKQDALQLIEADRQARAFADSITAEIVASGAATQSEVANALGQTLGTAGNDAGQDVGLAVTDSIIAEVANNNAAYVNAGRMIGMGLKEGIPQGLGGIGEIVASQIISETVGVLEALAG